MLEKDSSNFLIAVEQQTAEDIYNFENLKCEFKLEKQQLITPNPLNLTANQRLVVDEHKQILEVNGFSLSENLLLSFPVCNGTFFSVDKL